MKVKSARVLNGSGLLLVGLSALLPAPARAGGTKSSFDTAARKALHSLARGDLAGLESITAREGLLITRRRLDRDGMEKNPRPVKEPKPTIPTRGQGLSFSLSGLNAAVHQEEQVFFKRAELKQKAFRPVFRQFQYFISESYRSWPTGIAVAENLRATGYDPRYVGPAAEGKMASNYFWRVYFVREGGQWRIWKLEAEYTH